MGLATHEIERRSPLHPNNMGSCNRIWVAPTSAAYYVAAVAANTLAVGQILTLVANRCLGTGQSIFWTTGGAVALTINCTVRGRDQFGNDVSEVIDFAAVASGTTGFGTIGFTEISSITINTIGVSNAATISFGVSATANNLLAMPIRVTPFVMAAAALFAPSTAELFCVLDQTGVQIQIAQDVASPGGPAFGARYNTLKMNAAQLAGPCLVIHRLSYLGSRGP